MHENLVPGPFLVLAKSLKQAMHARNSFESKIRYFEKELSKDFILFTNKIMKNKRPGTSYQLFLGCKIC